MVVYWETGKGMVGNKMSAEFFNVAGTMESTVNVPPFTERVRKVYSTSNASNDVFLLATDKVEIVRSNYTNKNYTYPE